MHDWHARPPGHRGGSGRPPSLPTRRALLAAAGAGLLCPARGRAAGPGLRLLVAGPPGGIVAAWGARLAAAMAPMAAEGLDIAEIGGEDGVTGANQFAARAEPDGTTALLVPGSAALARLAGDPRAKFDPAGWTAVLAGAGCGFCAGSLDPFRTPRGTTVRVAASGPGGPETAALLAVELLGLDVRPVFGLAGATAADRALESGAVDLVYLHGPGTMARGAALAAVGFGPRLALGLPGDGGWQRDPGWPEVPTAFERFQGPTPLTEALAAVSAAAQVEFALVLPELTPATMVAQWRHMADTAADPLRGQGGDVVPLEAPETAALARALAPAPPAIVALRHWLAERLKWQPA